MSVIYRIILIALFFLIFFPPALRPTAHPPHHVPRSIGREVFDAVELVAKAIKQFEENQSKSMGNNSSRLGRPCRFFFFFFNSFICFRFSAGFLFLLFCVCVYRFFIHLRYFEHFWSGSTHSCIMDVYQGNHS